MFKNQKGPPFYIFRHCAAFSERKIFFQKNVLRFLSLRYSADLRRSRLVLLFTEPESEMGPELFIFDTVRSVPKRF